MVIIRSFSLTVIFVSFFFVSNVFAVSMSMLEAEHGKGLGKASFYIRFQFQKKTGKEWYQSTFEMRKAFLEDYYVKQKESERLAKQEEKDKKSAERKKRQEKRKLEMQAKQELLQERSEEREEKAAAQSEKRKLRQKVRQREQDLRKGSSRL